MGDTSPRAALINFLRETLSDESTGWVLFDGGTFVSVGGTITSPESYACALLDRYGTVVPGTPLGDFEVNPLGDSCWIVTFSHPRIMTFVSGAIAREQLGDRQNFQDFEIGLLGRSIREWDSKTKLVVHVESPRKGGPS